MVSPSLPVAALFVSSVLWGLAWLPLKYMHGLGLDGVPLTLVSYGAVALLLLPVCWRQARLWRGGGHMLLLIALLGGYANLSFALAMVYGDVVRAMVLFYLLPAWGVIGGRVFLGERIDGLRVLAVLLALAGAFLVLGGAQVFAAPPAPLDLLALSSGFALAMNNIAFRATPALPHWSKVSAIFTGCAILALVSLLGLQAPLPVVDASAWGWAVAFGLGWILVATAVSQWAVTHLEAGRASIILIVELVAAVVSATLLTDKVLQPMEMFGGVLIVIAAVVEARRESAVAASA
jgi:drug/metabolite transporter (DMT)-like permease